MGWKECTNRGICVFYLYGKIVNHLGDLSAIKRKSLFQDKLDLLRAFKIDREFEKMRSTNASVSYELNNVNRFFYEAILPARDCMKTLFSEEMAALDYKTNPSEALQTINNWVSNVTRDQIQEILSSSDVNEYTKLILVRTKFFV